MLTWLTRLVHRLAPGRNPAPTTDTSSANEETSEPDPAAPETSVLDSGGVGDNHLSSESGSDPEAPHASPQPRWRSKPPAFNAAERAEILSCNPDEIGTLASTIISELLASIDKVPPFPVVANKLIELSSQSDVRADLVGRVVVQDPVIAAKVISAANSPFYGLTSKVETVDYAIRIVGLHEVTQIAIAAAIAAIFDSQERVAFEAMTTQQQAAWAHALASARGASWLAVALGADVQHAYVAGLLHDIGKPVALRGLGFALLNGRLREPPTAALAMAAVEAAHTDIGAMLADSWALGDEMAAIIDRHHNGDDETLLGRIIMLASAVDEIRTNPAQRDSVHATITSTAGALGLSDEKVDELSDEVERAASLGLSF